MEIRKAHVKDISSIQAVAKQTWNCTYEGIIAKEVQEEFLRNAYSVQSLKNRMEKTLVLIAEVDGKLVGFINFSKNNDLTKQATLLAFYILPNFQKQGIGTSLLQNGIKELGSIDRLFVDVERDNEIGKNFYLSKGFRLEREYKEMFLGSQLNTLEMVLDLKKENKTYNEDLN